ncbi:hypothetical protein SAMD00023353_1400170 [Rosellinia necatrix]|uniref:Uncharacterized protein n=1 Tax=Rosellinia necatrix TaxID=77044 RepID=A0A1W2TCP2_ROSNE|nr:hypothetical protein SAMD00023353_1400170 [Rosellinia necatrix]
MHFATFALVAVSICSVFAAPSTIDRRSAILDAALTAVNTANATVANQLSIIVQGVFNLPVVQASLTNIATAIGGATSAVTPITNVALPLTNAELNVLLGLTDGVGDIESNVQNALNDILTTVPSLTGVFVKAQALAVLATIGPLTTPVTQFANSAIAGTTGPLTTAIQSSIASITSITSSLLGPILTAVLAL